MSTSVDGILPKLVLHFDVNETILLVDEAGGDTFEDCLNKIICKTALVNKELDSNGLPTLWADNQPINTKTPPPLCTDWLWPEGATSYYRAGIHAKEKAKKFTEHGYPGAQYRSLYKELENAVRWNRTTSFFDDNEMKNETELISPPDPRLSHDGVHHFLLPAFFKTITELKKRGRSFAIVIRTFGTDVEDVVNALQAFSEGKHLTKFQPVVHEMSQGKDNIYMGQYSRDTGKFQLTKKKHTTGKDEAIIITDEGEINCILQGDRDGISCVACTDDYQWWRSNNYSPSHGKPLYLTTEDDNYLPIFFDDNIHNDPNDSIVAIRQRTSVNDVSFSPLSGAETVSMQFKHLIKVPTVAPILNENYFLEQIEKCEKNFLQRKLNKKNGEEKSNKL
jgi:hypothetical protein